MKPKVIYATLGTAIVAFFLGWLIFGIFLEKYYQSQMTIPEEMMKNPPDMWALIITNLAWASLLVYIFHVWAGIKTFMKGLTGGMIVFCPIMIAFDFSMYGFMNIMTLQVTIVDIIVNIIFGGIIGGVAGLILGFGEKEVKSA